MLYFELELYLTHLVNVELLLKIKNISFWIIQYTYKPELHGYVISTELQTCCPLDSKFLMSIGNVNLTYEQNCMIVKYIFDYIKYSKRFLIVQLELNWLNMHIIWIHADFIFPSILFVNIIIDSLLVQPIVMHAFYILL